MLFLFLIFAAAIFCAEGDPPPLEPDFEGDSGDGEKLCKRKLYKKCFPVVGTCMGVGVKACASRDGFTLGAKVSSMFYLIRNRIFPMFTVGSKNFGISSDAGLDGKEDLDFLQDSTRFSLGVLGMFEYKKGDGEITDQSFRPIADDDELTAQYLFNLQGSTVYKALRWADMIDKDIKITVEGEERTIGKSFTLSPEFPRLDEMHFPRFSMSAYVTEEVAQEAQEEGLKKMVLDPGAIKIAINVTNCKCNNTDSDGFGILMFATTRSRTTKRTGQDFDNKDENKDYPSEYSDTNDVFKVNGEAETSDGGYYSFSRRFQVRKNMTKKEIFDGAIINSREYSAVQTKFKQIGTFNQTTRSTLKVQGREIELIWISIPGCDVDSFYWDPSIGFSGMSAEIIDDDNGIVVYISMILLLALFLF